ncbi:hypothetical protein M405DRAFT_753282, partial [Rhizopogon salebrosus TDB-379]
PHFYITINPADVYNLVVKFLATREIVVDDMLPCKVATYWPQSILGPRNPAVAAKFFNLHMKSFI